MSSIMQSHVGEESDELDISRIVYDLWSHKWIISGCVILALVLGFFYTLRLTPQYQAGVLLQVDSKQTALAGVAGSLQALFSNNTNDSPLTQISLIRSRFILEPVVNQLGLSMSVRAKATSWKQVFSQPKNTIKLASFSVPNKWINRPLVLSLDQPNYVSLRDPDNKLLAEGPVDKLLVSPRRDLQFKIEQIKAVVGSKFVLTKYSNEKVIEDLSRRLNIEEFGSNVRQNTGILEMRLKGDNPKQLVRILNTIAVTAQLKDAEKKAQEAEQVLSFLNKQLPITKQLLESAERELNHYRAKSGKIDIKLQAQILLNQLAEISKKEGELRIEKIQMSLQYTSIHPMMAAIDMQYKALEREKKVLNKSLEKLPEADQVAVNLMRDLRVKQVLYKILLKKIQELQVVKAGTVSSVRILAKAELPDSPLPSNKHLVWLVSAFAGVILSLLIIFLPRLLWPRINDPHWSEKAFNLPNLAIIPYCKEQLLNEFSRKINLIAYTHPQSLTIESLRSLRTSLQVALACETNKIISILGVSQGVGKSFISVNLAYLLASIGKRVLLIDTDIRLGTVHNYFDLPASPGLTDILTEKASLETVLKKINLHENLYVITRGSHRSDPSEILMSDQFKLMLDDVKSKYDLIIFDTAPVLLLTDAVLVARYASLNYLVVASGAHRPFDLELVLKRLSSGGVELNGTIFNYNKRTLSNNNNYYGQYYNSSYYNSSYYNDTLKS